MKNSRMRIVVLVLMAGTLGVTGEAHPDDLDKELQAVKPADPNEPVDVMELELESLLELQVTAATKQPIKQSDAPSTASVLVRDQIRDFGWDSINDLLYSLPGFTMSQDFERRTAGFRGEREPWNNNRLFLAWDGMPHNHIETGSANTWSATPLFFAKRIEVVRGPASAVYGSNALHGVVAIDSLDASDLGDGGVQTRLRAGTRTRSVDAVGAQKGQMGDAVIGMRAHGSLGDEYMSTDDSGRMDADGRPAKFLVQDEQNSTYLWLKAEPSTRLLEGLRLELHRETHEAETGRGWTHWAPDTKEYVAEKRTVVELSYRHNAGRLQLEQSLQYQHQRYQSDIRWYPAGAFDGFYPQGVSEVTDTSFQSLFARSQVRADIGSRATLLGGVEYSGLLYQGDRDHYANAQLVDPTGEYPQLDSYQRQGQVYEPIHDRPVHRLGGYGQLVSGDVLGKKVELTAGARYDALVYSYLDVAEADRPERSGVHAELSPRAGVIVRPGDPLRLKLMVGRAFRTPTIVEMFSANSWAAQSNPAGLRPEDATTYEVGADLAVSDALRLRGNAYYVDHHNVIDYSSDGLLHNVLSNRRVGAELELLAQRRVGSVDLDGYASYGYVRLVDESLADPALAPTNMLVWSPSHLVKAGLRAVRGKLGGTINAYYQSKTRRRASDRMDETFRTLRAAEIPGWLQLDTHVFVRPMSGVRIGVQGKNFLGTAGALVRPGDHGFDYRVPPREILGLLELDL